MDQVVCGSGGASDEPAVAAAGSDPSRRASGDVPAAAAGGGCFDCNICLDFAVEPVVTLCGHLYCWPCIYEWLRHGAAGGAHAGDGRISTRRPCPVCKAALTPDSLVPLYGRGGSGSSKKPRLGRDIPRRPTVHREATEHQDAQGSGDGERYMPALSPRHAHHHAGATRFDIGYPPPPLGRGMNMMHSTAGGVLGGMAVAVLPWVSRGQVPASARTAYFSSPYHLTAMENLSPRLRRQHMEVERSLHQIWFFLFVFIVLCLLLF